MTGVQTCALPIYGGTLCRDEVRYAVPGGALIERLFVRRDVEKIFAFRQETMRRRLG